MRDLDDTSRSKIASILQNKNGEMILCASICFQQDRGEEKMLALVISSKHFFHVFQKTKSGFRETFSYRLSAHLLELTAISVYSKSRRNNTDYIDLEIIIQQVDNVYVGRFQLPCVHIDFLRDMMFFYHRATHGWSTESKSAFSINNDVDAEYDLLNQVEMACDTLEKYDLILAYEAQCELRNYTPSPKVLRFLNDWKSYQQQIHVSSSIVTLDFGELVSLVCAAASDSSQAHRSESHSGLESEVRHVAEALGGAISHCTWIDRLLCQGNGAYILRSVIPAMADSCVSSSISAILLSNLSANFVVLGKALSTCSQQTPSCLTALDLSCNLADNANKSATALGSGLACTPHLKLLDLSYCDISPNGCRSVFQGLRNSQSCGVNITTLSLTRNRLATIGLLELQKWIIDMDGASSLERLYLGNSATTIDALTDVLSYHYLPKIKWVDLEGAKPSKKAVKSLLSFVSQMRYGGVFLKNIGNVDPQTLFEYGEKLISCDEGEGRVWYNISCNYLKGMNMSALPVGHSLYSLSLDECSLGASGIVSLCEHLMGVDVGNIDYYIDLDVIGDSDFHGSRAVVCPSLHRLSIAANIGDDVDGDGDIEKARAAKSLGLLINILDSLAVLVMNGNSFGASVKHFFRHVSRSLSLRCLDVRHVGMSDNEFVVLTSCLSTSNIFALRCFTGNVISITGLRFLMLSMETNQKLSILDFAGLALADSTSDQALIQSLCARILSNLEFAIFHRDDYALLATVNYMVEREELLGLEPVRILFLEDIDINSSYESAAPPLSTSHGLGEGEGADEGEGDARRRCRVYRKSLFTSVRFVLGSIGNDDYETDFDPEYLEHDSGSGSSRAYRLKVEEGGGGGEVDADLMDMRLRTVSWKKEWSELDQNLEKFI